MATDRGPSNLDRQVWQLSHLVRAATAELTALLSLNALLRESRASGGGSALQEMYLSAFSHSRASLSGFAQYIDTLRRRMPTAIANRDFVESNAYSALITAAYTSRLIPDMIRHIEGVPVATQRTLDGKVVQGVGWPPCAELEALTTLCEDMIRNREKGINVTEIGWTQGLQIWSERMGQR